MSKARPGGVCLKSIAGEANTVALMTLLTSLAKLMSHRPQEETVSQIKGEPAVWLKGFAAHCKPDDQSLVSRTHMKGRKELTPQTLSLTTTCGLQHLSHPISLSVSVFLVLSCTRNINVIK